MLSVNRCVLVAAVSIGTMVGFQEAGSDDSGLGQLAQAPAAEQPGEDYSPLEAADDTYQHAEQRRREAIGRQMGIMEYARQPRIPLVVPYVGPTVPVVPPGAARRAIRRAARASRDPYRPSYGAVIGLEPRPPVPYAGAWSYFPPVRQPIGHDRVWTGPNSYFYKPVYPKSFQPAPTEASRQPTPPWERPAQPEAEPVPLSVPQLPPADIAPGLPEPPAALLPGPQEL